MWVFSGGLHPPSTATVVRLRDRDVLTTDGPHLEGKEHIAGFTVIQAPDLDSALEWGAKPAGCSRFRSRSGRWPTKRNGVILHVADLPA